MGAAQESVQRPCVCVHVHFWLEAVTVRWTPKSGHTIGAIEALITLMWPPWILRGSWGIKSCTGDARRQRKHLFFRIDLIVARNYAMLHFTFCQTSSRVLKKIIGADWRQEYLEVWGHVMDISLTETSVRWATWAVTGDGGGVELKGVKATLQYSCVVRREQRHLDCTVETIRVYL